VAAWRPARKALPRRASRESIRPRRASKEDLVECSSSTRVEASLQVVVLRVRETCEHFDAIAVGDELDAVEDAPVPRPLKNEEFEGLLNHVKSAERPLRLTFLRPADVDVTASRSWNDFILQQRASTPDTCRQMFNS